MVLVFLMYASPCPADDSSLSATGGEESVSRSAQSRQDGGSFGLFPAEESALGDRIPLILVHGNNSESLDKNRWGDFVRLALQDSNFVDRYKMYLYTWNSRLPNRANGIILGETIDGIGELDNREIVLLAYSRGGIISRYFMNHYTTQRGNFANQLGGERVRYLVTLATPHRGSPGAFPAWYLFYLDLNYVSTLL